MAQRKETKKSIKVRDLKPKKDAKGGLRFGGDNASRNITGAQGRQQSGNRSHSQG